MPTMAKLFSAILLAGFGYMIADLVGGHLPEEVPQRSLRSVTAVFGIWIGWRFLGRRVRGEWRHAVGLGMSSALVLAFVALTWFSGYEMIRRAMRMAYGGNPVEALEDMFAIAIDNLQFMVQVDVLMAAVIGSAVIGLVVTAVSRIWP